MKHALAAGLVVALLAPAAALGARRLTRTVLARRRSGVHAPLAAMVQVLPIVVAVALALAAGFRLPDRFAWRDVVVVGCASGIGFTVALFFASASFPQGPMLDETKIGALLSLGAAIVAGAMAKLLGAGRFRAPA